MPVYGHSQDLARAKPLIERMGPAEFWLCIDDAYDNGRTKFLVRHNNDSYVQRAADDPSGAAYQYVAEYQAQPWFPHCWGITTPNEPMGDTDRRLPAYTAFEGAVVRLLRLQGKACVVNNMGTGNRGHIVPGAEYYGGHVYGWDRTSSQGDDVLCLNWMQAIQKQQPNATFFLTEVGITRLKVGGDDKGWREDGPSAGDYWTDLAGLDSLFQRVLGKSAYQGAFVFQAGGF